MDYEKSRRQAYSAVRVGEQDLVRLASILQHGVAGLEPPDIEIQITSVTGEDIFKSSDPQVFLNSELPRSLRGVTISYGKLLAPVTCYITLENGFYGPYMSVSGSDPNVVSGLYQQLKEELDGHVPAVAPIVERVHGVSLWSLLFPAFATLSCLGVIDFIRAHVSGVITFSTEASLVLTVPLCVLAFFAGGTFLENQTKKALPRVMFDGRFEDSGTASRRRVLAVWGLFLLPILRQAFVSLIADSPN